MFKTSFFQKLILKITLILTLAIPVAAQPYDGFFLPFHEAGFASDNERPTDGDPDTCDRERIGVAAASNDVEGGNARVVNCEYDVGNDTYVVRMSWFRPYPRRLVNPTYHAYLVWSYHDDAETGCSLSCVGGNLCAVTDETTLDPDQFCEAANRYTISSPILSLTSFCDSDASSCTQDSDCSGAGDYCYSTLQLTELGGVQEGIVIGNDDFGSAGGTETLCSGVDCINKRIKWMYEFDADASVAEDNVRHYGIFVIVNAP